MMTEFKVDWNSWKSFWSIKKNAIILTKVPKNPCSYENNEKQSFLMLLIQDILNAISWWKTNFLANAVHHEKYFYYIFLCLTLLMYGVKNIKLWQCTYHNLYIISKTLWLFIFLCSVDVIQFPFYKVLHCWMLIFVSVTKFYSISYYRNVLGMVTVGNMMAKVVRNKVKPSDPVSEIMYKQFKQVGVIHF